MSSTPSESMIPSPSSRSSTPTLRPLARGKVFTMKLVSCSRMASACIGLLRSRVVHGPSAITIAVKQEPAPLVIDLRPRLRRGVHDDRAGLAFPESGALETRDPRRGLHHGDARRLQAPLPGEHDRAADQLVDGLRTASG